jgi:predicted RNA methylase
MTPRSPGAGGARSIIAAHERSVPVEQRRDHGVHYTPADVAAAVIDLAISALGRLPRTVCDPTCGAGAFLLSAAERLHAEGIGVAEIVTQRLVGVELDPASAAVARTALVRWAGEHGVEVAASEVRIEALDALSVTPSRWPWRPDGGFDLVVGNPPFLSQLATRTARAAPTRAAVAQRFGSLGAYTDSAGLFLLAALELCGAGAVAAMLQPLSFLAARDTQVVRDRLMAEGDLAALWGSDEQLFADASVQVCAPVLRRHDAASSARPSTAVRWRSSTTSRYTSPRPAAGASWGPLLAPALGVPAYDPAPGSRRVAEIASATAGFRDEYYALRDASTGADPADGSPLVTVGMIDPFELRWALGTHRLGGRAVSCPRVDLAALAARTPAVARWVEQRRRPKVLLATQTKVVEAVVDPVGDLVPMTPVISVEPGDTADVWRLAAALSAPPLSASVAGEQLGSGRSAGSLRWSARGVVAAPLPSERDAWDRGAAIVQALSAEGGSGRARDEAFGRFAREMTRAYGLPEDHPVVSWWSDRRPRR